MLEIGKQTHYQREMLKKHMDICTPVSVTDKRRIIQRYPESEKNAFKRALQQQLKQVSEIAARHNIQIRIDCGTLLGFHRDRKMLPWDFDNDVSCMLSDLTREFVDDLMYHRLLKPRRGLYYFNHNMQEFLNGFEGDGVYFEPKILKVVSDQKFFNNSIAVCTDIFTWVPYNGKLYSHLSNHMHMVQDPANVFPLYSAGGSNQHILLPNNPDTYLEWMYGPNWRTPNPNHKDRISACKGLENRTVNGMIMQNLVTKDIVCKPIELLNNKFSKSNSL